MQNTAIKSPTTAITTKPIIT